MEEQDILDQYPILYTTLHDICLNLIQNKLMRSEDFDWINISLIRDRFDDDSMPNTIKYKLVLKSDNNTDVTITEINTSTKTISYIDDAALGYIHYSESKISNKLIAELQDIWSCNSFDNSVGMFVIALTDSKISKNVMANK